MPAVGITDGPPTCAHDHRPLVLPPSHEVDSAWVSLSLVGCRCTRKGVFQRNPQSYLGI